MHPACAGDSGAPDIGILPDIGTLKEKRMALQPLCRLTFWQPAPTGHTHWQQPLSSPLRAGPLSALFSMPGGLIPLAP